MDHSQRGDQPQQAEFKLQFIPALLVGGRTKKKDAQRNKYYVAVILQGQHQVHESAVQHKTASEAIAYANKITSQYKRLAQAALLAFIEEDQHVEPTN